MAKPIGFISLFFGFLLFFSCTEPQVCDCMDLSIEIYNKTKFNDSLIANYTKTHQNEIRICNEMFENLSNNKKEAINDASKNCDSYLNFVSINKKKIALKP